MSTNTSPSELMAGSHPPNIPHDGGGGGSARQLVDQPESKEDWDAFIVRYSQGHYSNCAFPNLSQATRAYSQGEGGNARGQSKSTPAPSSPTRPPRSPLQPGADARQGDKMETMSDEPVCAVDLSQSQEPPSSEASLVSRSSDSEAVYASSGEQRRSMATAAGPSNQDPHIPNMDSGELPEYTKRPQGAELFRSRREGDANQEEGLTRENMRQLDIQSEEGPSQRTWGSRRTRVELASFVRAKSRSSSDEEEVASYIASRRRPPRKPRSRGSLVGYSRAGSVAGSVHGGTVDLLLDSSIGSSSASGSQIALDFNLESECPRIKNFYQEHGYLPAPRQTPDAMRRRLRVLRRLGLERPDGDHFGLDRFVRLALSVFKVHGAFISVVGRDREHRLASCQFNKRAVSLEDSITAHAIVSTSPQCLVIPDATKDWRFSQNPFVTGEKGILRFVASAPLAVGSGPKAALFGAISIFDPAPREFGQAEQAILVDIADCVVNELELLYTRQASIESAKLHQISVDFLRRSLKSRPHERAGRVTNNGSSGSSQGHGHSDKSGNKRSSGADLKQDQQSLDIYDEACSEIRQALDAYAVAVVDLSQFHLFYPAFQGSSTGGSITKAGGSARSSETRKPFGGSSSVGEESISGKTATPSMPGANISPPAQVPAAGEDDHAAAFHDSQETEAYQYQRSSRRARQTYALTDPTAPSRTPQVLYIPTGHRADTRKKLSETMRARDGRSDSPSDDLAVLGYSCAHDDFAFNFSTSPQAKKIIANFIAANVKTRQVWYTRDDSEGVASSINHLMPPGTETSLAMPIFGFDGQVAFAVVACWTDPLYTYPSGAMQFVETIAGSLLAAVMKERLHQAERAQLNFAAAASHELRTPLHQINAAVTLLRSSLENTLRSPGSSPEKQAPDIIGPPNVFAKRPSLTEEDRSDALAQLEIIETNGMALGTILENIIDTLDIGRLSSKLEERVIAKGPAAANEPYPAAIVATRNKVSTMSISSVLENVVMDCLAAEERSRRLAGKKGLDDVEIVLEVLPRGRGTWQMAQDSGPLARALSKIVLNACKYTDEGYVHITVQDVSRGVILPAGYDNSIKTSIVSIDIKDSGRGMSTNFLENEVFRPFSRVEAFSPGSGLGLGLAQRMIELLGGKLAIASTLGKGTLIHVEVPLHLLNEDNESDQDELRAREGDVNTGRSVGSEERYSSNKVRQDGIFLVGFDTSPALKRVGKSLLRQLKLHFCRIVPEIHYASLIIAPDIVSNEKLAALARSARPTVELVTIGNRARSQSVSGILTDSQEEIAQVFETIDGFPVRRLTRPLRPSILEDIMRPAQTAPHVKETYFSPAVGDEDAAMETKVATARTHAEQGEHQGVQPHLDTERPWISPSTTPSTGAGTPGTGEHDDSALGSVLAPTTPSSIRSDDLLPSPLCPPDLGELMEMPPLLRPMREDFEAALLEGSEPLGEKTNPPTSVPVQDQDAVPESDENTSEKAIGTQVGSLSVVPPFPPSLGRREAPRVLIVEDNEVNRKILITMLKRTSCAYAEAVDGFDAVIQFKAFKPHLVLLDINMPRKDGFQAAVELRGIERAEGRPRAKIVAVTAMSSEAHRRKGLVDCGIDVWKAKPVSIKVLKEIVEDAKLSLKSGVQE